MGRLKLKTRLTSVCCVHTKPFFIAIDIQETQSPCPSTVIIHPEEILPSTSSVVTSYETDGISQSGILCY